MDASKSVIWTMLIIAALTVGCRLPRRTYDKPPERGLFEDRFAGHYFNEVHASFSLPLHAPGPSLLRDFRKPIQIVSNNPNAAKSISGTPDNAPTHATVKIDYRNGSAEPMPRTVSVTLHWLKADEPIGDGTGYVTETREITIGFREIKKFLEESGRFRVDPDEHFYGRLRWEQDPSDVDRIAVKIAITGPNKDAAVASNHDYKNSGHLYQLIDSIWPGAR